MSRIKCDRPVTEVYHLTCHDDHDRLGVVSQAAMKIRFGDALTAAGVWRAQQQAEKQPDPFYELVAKLAGDDLEKAFRLTNSIDRPWTKNDEVEVVGTSRRRSTSVGDIAVVRSGASVPAYWFVAPVGFEEIRLEQQLVRLSTPAAGSGRKKLEFEQADPGGRDVFNGWETSAVPLTRAEVANGLRSLHRLGRVTREGPHHYRLTGLNTKIVRPRASPVEDSTADQPSLTPVGMEQ